VVHTTHSGHGTARVSKKCVRLSKKRSCPRGHAMQTQRTSQWILVAAVAAVATCAVAVWSYVEQLQRLQTRHSNAKHLLPMCRLIARFLAECGTHSRPALLKVIENSPFCASRVLVFCKDIGDVWVDCYDGLTSPGNQPVPPTDCQAELYRVMADAGAHIAVDGRGVRVEHFGRCYAREEIETLVSVGVVAGDLLVVIQVCGCTL